MKSELEKLFGVKLGQRVRVNGTTSKPEPDMRHQSFEGDVHSFVIPNEGSPFAVVISGRKETGARRSHHVSISDLQPLSDGIAA